MKRTYHITFMRKAEPDENIGHEYFFDGTEFDTDAQKMEDVCVDLMNLFNDFVAENHFEDVTVSEIYEVPYDGDEE